MCEQQFGAPVESTMAEHARVGGDPQGAVRTRHLVRAGAGRDIGVFVEVMTPGAVVVAHGATIRP